MNLVRIDPFRDIRTLHSRFDRLFNNAFVHQPSVAPDEPRHTNWLPTVDVYEGDNQITLRAELPGLAEEDIELTIDQAQLFLP